MHRKPQILVMALWDISESHSWEYSDKVKPLNPSENTERGKVYNLKHWQAQRLTFEHIPVILPDTWWAVLKVVINTDAEKTEIHVLLDPFFLLWHQSYLWCIQTWLTEMYRVRYVVRAVVNIASSCKQEEVPQRFSKSTSFLPSLTS